MKLCTKTNVCIVALCLCVGVFFFPSQPQIEEQNVNRRVRSSDPQDISVDEDALVTSLPALKIQTTPDDSMTERQSKNNDGPGSEDEPPEPLDSIEFCAEKCKHLPEMCNGLYQKTYFPAPKCEMRSTSKDQDQYFPPKNFEHNNSMRYRRSVVLTKWAAKQARNAANIKENCEDLLDVDALVNATMPGPYGKIWTEVPMMWPEEFEIIVKTFAQLKPGTYLEWGCGKSTNFYPLLASGQVIALDNYPPWCEIISKSPVVKCVMEKQKRFRFECVAPAKPDGTEIELLSEGRVARLEDRQYVAATYVNAIDNVGIKLFDIALVDGRYRAACALKLLNYIGPKSVVFIHDFFARPKYYIVFKYYDVIGYARSLVVLRRKSDADMPSDFATAYERVIDIQE
eukprot:m.40421 g.40421  ORF g.40421 m.40421 type:complete len:399 (+) comp18480_c0_seq1:392-1588(+)